MYKIKEVANLLGVETIEIHKKLVNLRQDLKGHTVKKNGVTLIDEKGLSIIERSFVDIDDVEILDVVHNDEIEDDVVLEVGIDEDVDSNIDLDIDTKILELKKSINKTKNALIEIDTQIVKTSNVLQQSSVNLESNIKKLKLLEKEFYKNVNRR